MEHRTIKMSFKSDEINLLNEYKELIQNDELFNKETDLIRYYKMEDGLFFIMYLVIYDEYIEDKADYFQRLINLHAIKRQYYAKHGKLKE